MAMTLDLLAPGPPRIWVWLAELFTAETDVTPGPGPASIEAPHAIDISTADVDALIAEHADAAYRVALSITRDRDLAQDITQDALLKAWQKLPTFRGDAPLRNWILRITHNTAISTLRRRREEPRDPDTLPERPAPGSVPERIAGRLALEEFAHALDELDDLSRSIVVLREVEGLSYEEISQLLDVPLPTVKTRLLRARRHLAVSLAEWRP